LNLYLNNLYNFLLNIFRTFVGIANAPCRAIVKCLLLTDVDLRAFTFTQNARNYEQ